MAKRGTARDEALASAARGAARSRLTSRLFVGVEVILVVTPLAFAGMAGVAGDSLGVGGFQGLMETDPTLGIGLVASCAQVLVAHLLRMSQRHLDGGDAGYALSNLVCLLCAEMLLRSVVGVVGVGMLLLRVWRSTSGSVSSWASGRGVRGVLADVSGALVVAVIGAICALCYWRLGV